MKLPLARSFTAVLALLTMLAFSGCRTNPRFAVGDHLIPLGSSDPTQIVTVVAVENDSYQLSTGVTAGPPDTMQTRTRKEIDSYYVRVADLPVGGSWIPPEAKPSPTPSSGPQNAPVATPPPATPTPTPAPLDPTKVSAAVRPAVVRILVFDGGDKQTRTGTGFFVSADGRIVTTTGTVEGAAKALVEMPSGAIKNVSGILASSPPADLVILKTEITGAPSVRVKNVARPEAGKQVAVVTGGSRKTDAIAATVAAVRRDEAGDSLQLSGTKLHATAGSPVVDERGELLAFVTADESGPALNSVRSATAIESLLAQIPPNAAPSWPAVAGQTPTPTPTPTAKPKTSPSPTSARNGDATIVYSPYPRYPAAARFSYFGPQQGTGQFLVKFAPDGSAMSVHLIKSTGSALLDQAAMDALKYWRAQRGRPSQKIVPITFRRP